VEYCYHIIAEYAGGRSISKKTCVTAISDAIPPAIADATATISGNTIELQFELPTGIQSENFHVVRYAPDGSESSFDIDAQTFTDTEVNPGSGRYCYTIGYGDACGNTSEISSQICPVFLTLTPATGFNQLEWTAYTGWVAGTQSYMLEVLDENGNITESIDVTGQFSYETPIDENNQKLQYRIKVLSNGQPLESFSNMVSVTYEHQLFFPSAFTPDNDGLNDTFGGKGRFIQDYSLKIFNRWGELLFVSNSLDIGWDGQYRGSPAPDGSYVYKADGTDLNGTGFSKAGSFVLLRNK
jgi:gliding motility-associated-like protein